jgi:RNA polymerase sigma-70 factor (ECF subfamily)
MKKQYLKDEQNLLIKIREGDKEAFSLLFTIYYKDLVLFGGNFLADRGVCEDIVQSIFLRLWEDREKIVIESSIKSYLLKSVRNSCMDEFRHRQVVYEHESYMLSNHMLHDYDTENYILYSDLQKHIDHALAQLPEVSREAFELNRFDGLKYCEIAQRLAVSERTVEERISKAIRLLKKFLQDFLIGLIFIWMC